MTSTSRSTAVAPGRRASISVLVVDDELNARQRIRTLLRPFDNIQIVGSTGDGGEAIRLLRAMTVDLMFLEIRLPKISGWHVIQNIGAERIPPTIFVTALDRHAVEAFDVGAVDYLLKPFEDERFTTALRRGVAAVARTRGTPVGELWSQGRDSYTSRVAASLKGKLYSIPVQDIDYILAAGPYAELFVGTSRHLVRSSMNTMISQLDPNHFMRVHRSVIVRLEGVLCLHRFPGGVGAVDLKCGKRLPVSRTRRAHLQNWMGVAR